MDDVDPVPNERAALKLGGEFVAEAWYEAEGESSILVVRVPRERLEIVDPSRRLTVEILLMAASLSNDDVESWRLADASPSDDLELSLPLPPPLPDATHLTIYVRLKPPAQASAHEPEIALETWHFLEARWKVLLGLEGSIETSRLGMDGLRSEMESAFKKSLAVEEKLHGLQADIAQWTRAKSRIHHALPKAREFIHRATWALAVPERKRLEEIYKNHIEPRIPLPQVDRVREQLEHLQKERQVLLAQGNAVYQDCRSILAEVQRAVSTLQRNAADNARRKRDAKSQKGKQF